MHRGRSLEARSRCPQRTSKAKATPRGSPRDIHPRAGTLVAFLSSTLHEVTPVTAGVRDTVVDWLYEAD